VRILVDTGFWLALCDERDTTVSPEYLAELAEAMNVHTVVLPWPVMYETIRTEFVQNKSAMERFHKEVESPRIEIVHDATFRDDAYRLCVSWALERHRPISLTDWILRLILEDPNFRIDSIVTFNAEDFHDVCRREGIQLWDKTFNAQSYS
jgi:predicted nucleic acid-binding protein